MQEPDKKENQLTSFKDKQAFTNCVLTTQKLLLSEQKNNINYLTQKLNTEGAHYMLQALVATYLICKNLRENINLVELKSWDVDFKAVVGFSFIDESHHYQSKQEFICYLNSNGTVKLDKIVYKEKSDEGLRDLILQNIEQINSLLWLLNLNVQCIDEGGRISHSCIALKNIVFNVCSNNELLSHEHQLRSCCQRIGQLFKLENTDFFSIAMAAIEKLTIDHNLAGSQVMENTNSLEVGGAFKI